MANLLERLQFEGNPFVASMIREAVADTGPYQGYIYLEAIRRLWVLTVRSVSINPPSLDMYRRRLDLQELKQALEEKENLDEASWQALFGDNQEAQILKLVNEILDKTLDPDFVANGDMTVMGAVSDLVMELVRLVEPVAFSSVVVRPSDDENKIIMEFRGASGWSVRNDQEGLQAGTFLRLPSGIRGLGPVTAGNPANPLLPLGVEDFFEDVAGRIFLRNNEDLQKITSDRPEDYGQAMMGKNLVFWGKEPVEAFNVVVEKGLDTAAAAIANWGAIYYGTPQVNMQLMEALTSHPQTITPMFMTLFDRYLRDELDTMLDQAKTSGDDETHLKYLLIKQALEPDPKRKVVALSTMANLYEERLHDMEGLFYTSCSLFEMEPGPGEGLDDLVKQAERLDKQEELAEILVRVVQEAGLDKESACAVMAQAAVSYMDAGAKQEALDTASLALQWEPASQDTLARLCGVFERMGDLNALKDCLQQRLSHAETTGDALSLNMDLANLFKSRLGNREKALKHYYEAFKIEPANEQVFNALKSELLEQGRVDEVADMYAKSLARTMEPAARVRLLKGYAQITDNVLKDAKRTIGLLRELMVLQPEMGEEAERLFELYIQEGDVDQAVALGWKLAMDRKDATLFKRVIKEARPLQQVWLIRASKDVFPDTEQEEVEALVGAGMYADAARLLEALAERGGDEKGTDFYLKAAQLYESEMGLLEKALECYNKAYSLRPSAENVDKLARLYQELGKGHDLYLFLHDNLEKVDDPDTKARMMGWMGEIAAREMKDIDIAIQYLDRALDLAPTRFDLAERLYDILVEKGDIEKALVTAETALETAMQVNDRSALGKFTLLAGKAALETGDDAKAIRYLEGIKDQESMGADLLIALGKAYTMAGKPRMARDVLQDVMTRFGQEMNASEKAMVLEELGDAAMAESRYEMALKLYLDCRKAMPGNYDVLDKALHAAKEAHDFYTAVDVLEDILYQVKDDERRFDLLVQLGDLYAHQLKQRYDAETAYRKALEIKKDSRSVLHKLLQMYVEAGEYQKTSGILTELLRVEENGTKKANYHHTAGMLALEHLNDREEALKHFEQTLAYEPTNTDVLEMMLNLYTEQKNYEAMVNLLKKQAGVFRSMDEKDLELQMLERLKDLYTDQLHNPVRAAEVMSEIAAIRGKTPDDLEVIAENYARMKSTMGRSLETYMELLKLDPTRKNAYKAIRDLYRNMGDMDGFWSVCGVLSVLGLASPEEVRYYNEHKQAALRLTRDHLSPEDFKSLVASQEEDSNTLLLLELLWPALRQALVWQQPSEVGISKDNIIDVNGSGAFETIYRVVVRMLGIKAPRVYLMSNVSGISKVPFNPPALVVGEDVYKKTRGKELRFLLGRYLTLFTPGRLPFGVVDVKTLKSALTAVTKLSFPSFVIPEDDQEASALLTTLSEHMAPDALARIRDVISRFRREHLRIDFEAQAAAVDMSASHMGFFMSDDIAVALKMLKGIQDGFSSLQTADKIVELTRYACSPRYVNLRKLMLKR